MYNTLRQSISLNYTNVSETITFNYIFFCCGLMVLMVVNVFVRINCEELFVKMVYCSQGNYHP